MFCFLCFTCISTKGQLLYPQSAQDTSYVYRVKLIQQFVGRFNHTESFEGINLGLFENNSERKRYLASLFLKELVDSADREMLHTFVNDVVNRNITISQLDTSWYAVLNCEASYQGQKTNVLLTLQIQVNPDMSVQWMIVGAKANHLQSSKDTAKSYLLGNAHEMNFMRLFIHLQDDQKNIKQFVKCAKGDDALTIVKWLIYTGELKVHRASEVSFYFLQVPGWVFSVKEFNRKGFNSGWLIYHLEEADKIKKEKMLSEDFGISG